MNRNLDRYYSNGIKKVNVMSINEIKIYREILKESVENLKRSQYRHRKNLPRIRFLKGLRRKKIELLSYTKLRLKIINKFLTDGYQNPKIMIYFIRMVHKYINDRVFIKILNITLEKYCDDIIVSHYLKLK